MTVVRTELLRAYLAGFEDGARAGRRAQPPVEHISEYARGFADGLAARQDAQDRACLRHASTAEARS